jgi:hypothetical protein
MNPGLPAAAPTHDAPAGAAPTLVVLAAAALFFAGALYAAVSYGALPALLEQAGRGQIIYFCH